MAPFLAGDEHIILVFALFPCTVTHGRHAVAVLPVGQPLAFVAETVASLAHAESSAFVVLPFTQVGFCDTSIQMFILYLKKKLFNNKEVL